MRRRTPCSVGLANAGTSHRKRDGEQAGDTMENAQIKPNSTATNVRQLLSQCRLRAPFVMCEHFPMRAASFSHPHTRRCWLKWESRKNHHNHKNCYSLLERLILSLAIANVSLPDPIQPIKVPLINPSIVLWLTIDPTIE